MQLSRTQGLFSVTVARPAWTHRCVCVVQGLLLDLDVATLTVWVNGERKGVMARPGMTDYDGEPVARLEGPLRWAVDRRGWRYGRPGEKWEIDEIADFQFFDK